MSDKTFTGALLGLVAGFFLWGGQPAYIDSLTEDAKSESGEPYILMKHTFAIPDQIAIVHGLVDDLTGCETFRAALESEGGSWSCVPASAVKNNDPWWQFW